MAPILNLPVGYWLASIHLGGAALPLGATITVAGVVNGSGDTPTLVATAVKNNLIAAGGPFDVNNINMSNSATFVDVLVKFGPLDTGPAATVSSGSVLGNVGGDAEPPSVALLINKSTASGGRRGRGRMFVPGLPESSVGNGGFVVAARQTALQTAWTQFFNAMNTGNRFLQLLHRYDPDLGQTPQTPTVITSLDVQSLVATQRQRMRR